MSPKNTLINKAGTQNQNIVILIDKLVMSGGVLYLKLKSSS